MNLNPSSITTMKRSVRFHGWTLAKGTQVYAQHITLPHSGQQEAMVTLRKLFSNDWMAAPISAVEVKHMDLQTFRYDEATGRMVEVAS